MLIELELPAAYEKNKWESVNTDLKTVFDMQKYGREEGEWHYFWL